MALRRARAMWLVIVLVGAVTVLGASGCSRRSRSAAPTPAGSRVASAPAPRQEVRPPKPYPDAVWVRGHWRWNGRAYVWFPGRWYHKPGGKTWVTGHWEKRASGWAWVPGHWR